MVRLLLLLFALGSCVRSNSATCSDGSVCAAGRVCDEANHLCVFPDQLASCVDRADGQPCTAEEPTPRPGECVNQVCVPAVCGDHIVVLGEACDGAGTAPAVGTCVDFNFDYGSLECSSQCSTGLDQCKRLGWQFANLGGAGRLFGLWEDGDVVWAVGASQVYRRQAGAWAAVVDPALERLNADGVWARDGHVFVVGERDASGHVAHFDGTQWTDTTLPASLHAVYGRAPDDVFVVGADGYIGHFDGTSWTAMGTPVSTELRAISGSGQDVIVVGFGSTVLRLGQGGWERDTNATLPTAGFTGVWQAGPDDVYVVGALSTITHWNGSSWATTPLTGLVRTLHGISGRSPTEIYVVGDADENGRSLFLWDGVGWTPMVSPSSEDLFAVHAGPRGTYASISVATTLEYAGAGWLELAPPAPTATIKGLWSSGSFATAVGDACTFQVVDQGNYSTQGLFGGCSCGTSALLDVWGPPGPSATPLYAGGTGGLMVHRTLNGWECDQPLPAELVQPTTVVRSISGSSATSAFAVGRARGAAMLLHNPGTGWRDLSSVLPPLSASLLNGVWAAGPDEAFIVGAQATIVHYKNGIATQMPSGVTNINLASVWGASPDDVYAVGENTTILHYDGVAWQRVTEIPVGITFSTSVSFEDVHGRSASDVWVVGGRILLHWDGAHWEAVARPDADRTFQVSASPGGVVVGTTKGIGQRLFGL